MRSVICPMHTDNIHNFFTANVVICCLELDCSSASALAALVVPNASNILPRRFLNPDAIAYRIGPPLNTGQTQCDRQLGTKPPKQNIWGFRDPLENASYNVGSSFTSTLSPYIHIIVLLYTRVHSHVAATALIKFLRRR